MNQSTLDFSDLEDMDEFAAASVKTDTRKKFPCVKCAGTGKFLGHRLHQTSRKCFTCNGKGYFLTSDQARRNNRKTAADRKTERVAAAKAKIMEDHKAVIDWITDNSGWNNFASSLLGQLEERGSLTEKQLDRAEQMMIKAEATRKTREANGTIIDISRIVELFASVAAKRPILRFGPLSISRAPDSGRNAGALYVKDDHEYGGKITREGKWCPVGSARSEIKTELIELAADPMAAVVKHGRVTGSCACCGRELTKASSIELGVGPVCAEKWQL